MLQFRCNGIEDCPNGEDEGKKHCEEKWKCLDNEFKCKNGQCISQRHHCNGIFDCGDRSDEENCEKNCKIGNYDDKRYMHVYSIPNRINHDDIKMILKWIDRMTDRKVNFNNYFVAILMSW